MNQKRYCTYSHQDLLILCALPHHHNIYLLELFHPTALALTHIAALWPEHLCLISIYFLKSIDSQVCSMATGYPILHHVPNHVTALESNFLSQVTKTRLFSKAANVESCLELAALGAGF